MLEDVIREIVRDEFNKQKTQEKQNLPKPAPVDPKWYTAKDFCKEYSVSRSTLQRMRRQGRVDVLDGGNRIIRYRWKEEEK